MTEERREEKKREEQRRGGKERVREGQPVIGTVKLLKT